LSPAKNAITNSIITKNTITHHALLANSFADEAFVIISQGKPDPNTPINSFRPRKRTTTMKILRTVAILCAAAALVLTASTDAFAPQQQQYAQHANDVRTTTTTSLAATGKRREIFGWLKKAAVLGFGYKTSSLLSEEATYALEEAVNGRIVTFQVNNLGGEVGQTGTFKIQMAPTWAPRGVARFEVRALLLIVGRTSLCNLNDAININISTEVVLNCLTHTSPAFAANSN
jgi:hypothetical protein